MNNTMGLKAYNYNKFRALTKNMNLFYNVKSLILKFNLCSKIKNRPS